MFTWFRRRRRRRLLAEPFPHHWEVLLRRNVHLYDRLADNERERLRDTLRILIAEKSWEGCGGIFVTEEIKLVIAANAALLLLGGIDPDHFERVPSIIVYPSEFRTPVADDDWEDDELSDTMKDGQAVYRGPVILSWDAVLAESRDPGAGHNVVLHEFAHQLDFLDDEINGTPPMAGTRESSRWQQVMSAALERHRLELESGVETFFTEEAAENETEFFADATEAFYCLPHTLKAEHPDLYEVLRDYFRVDPSRWITLAEEEGHERDR